MNVGVIRDKLLSGSSMASKIVGSRTNLPVLNNLLLTASDQNYLQIESSNLEISIRLRIPAKVEQPGQTTVPARKFAEYIASLKEEKLSLRLDKNQLHVEGENNKTSFVTTPANEYPELPARTNNSKYMEIKSVDFHRLVKKTVFATAMRSDQIVLTGVLFDFTNNGSLTAVASDSFRLSLFESPLNQDLGKTVIIPAQTLNEVDRLISEEANLDPDSSGQVQVYFSDQDNQVFFQVGQTEIISRLLDANFPDYRRLIPPSFSLTASFDRLSFIDAVRTSSIFASREGQLIRLGFEPESGRLQLTAQSSEVGSHSGQLNAEIKGQPIELGFNSKYLLEAVGSFDSEKVKVSSVDPRSAVLFESIDTKESYRHIVMPMDINV